MRGCSRRIQIKSHIEVKTIDSRIYCIVPAAGLSTRFPWNKLLYVHSDKPLIAQTIQNILESGVVDKVVVVTGHMRKEIENAVVEAGFTVDLVENPAYATGGMSSSIKTGLNYIIKKYGFLTAVMINPADVAWVHPGVYSLIVAKFLDNKDRYKIAVAGYRGKRGHPVLFSSSILGDLLFISEEKEGLKEVIQKYKYDTLVVETEYPGVLLDIDTILDILKVKSILYK